MIAQTDYRNPFSKGYPLELSAEIQKYLTLDERQVLNQVSQTVFTQMTAAAETTEQLKSETFKESEKPEYLALLGRIHAVPLQDKYFFNEYKTSNSVRRWYELMVLNMPPETKLENFQVKVWKGFNKLPEVLVVTIYLLSGVLLGGGLGAAIVLPFTFFLSPISVTLTLGAIALVGLGGGNLIASNVFFRAKFNDECTAGSSVMRPSDSMQKYKCVYIFNKRYDKTVCLFLNQSRLQGIPIQESTYIELKKRFEQVAVPPSA